MSGVKLGCVIMASGEGKRFAAAGGDALAGNKLLAPLAGEPLIVRTAASVPQERFEVVVSTRWPQVADAVEHSARGVRVVRHNGMLRSESVRAGLSVPEAEAWDGCLFLPGDQPLVEPASFEALADAFARDPRRVCRLAWHDRPASPVLFPRSCFAALRQLEGTDGGASILCAGAVPVELVEAVREEELWDVDTPADLARIETSLSSVSGTLAPGNQE